jgi:cell division protein FtsB
MSLVREIRRYGRHVIGSALWVLAMAYFMFHAVQGERGLLTWMQVRQQVAVAETELALSAVERERWEARIAQLRSNNLDPDLLDERARYVAGLGRPNEIVIFNRLGGGVR